MTDSADHIRAAAGHLAKAREELDGADSEGDLEESIVAKMDDVLDEMNSSMMEFAMNVEVAQEADDGT